MRPNCWTYNPINDEIEECVDCAQEFHEKDLTHDEYGDFLCTECADLRLEQQ